MLVLRLVAGLGSLQAALLLLLIGFRYRHRRNLPLAFLLLVYSLRLGTIPTWNPESLLAHPWLLPAMAPLPFLFGPLLWMYVREIRAGGVHHHGGFAVVGHLLPYLLGMIVLAIPLFVLRPEEYRALIASIFEAQAPVWFNIQNWAKVVVNVLYVGFTIRIAFTELELGLGRARRLWLRTLAIAPIPSLVFYIYIAARPAVSAELVDGSHLPFALLAVAMALLVYAVSMLVLVSPEVPNREVDRMTGTHVPIGDEECETIAEQARRELEAGAYRDPDLSLSELADTLGVHPNRLSFALNRIYGLSFPTLVNRRRIEYFLLRAREGALDNENILQLALESGFSSKSTFNRVFKDTLGVSPSRFCAAHDPQGYGSNLSVEAPLNHRARD